MIENVRRMVIKVGTATIAEESGKISHGRVRDLVAQIAEARRGSVEVVLVSSGAIAAGVERMKMGKRPEEMSTLQAVASIGQGILIGIYADLFSEQRITVGQVLLTQRDMINREQYINARQTLEKLLGFGSVPIVNENDTVATEEIAFGENDLLAAQVAALISADLLVLLTDTPGLYTADPGLYEEAELLTRVEEITEEVEILGGGSGSYLASGGMSSKIQAAKVAVCSGIGTVITDGRDKEVIPCLLEGECKGTYFPASETSISARKVWIAFARPSRGAVIIDSGAAQAVKEEGRSLLAAGVEEAEGDFLKGDAVEIRESGGEVIGKGLVNYDRGKVVSIKGLRSDEIETVLGERGEEVVHRDFMVVYKKIFKTHGKS